MGHAAIASTGNKLPEANVNPGLINLFTAVSLGGYHLKKKSIGWNDYWRSKWPLKSLIFPLIAWWCSNQFFVGLPITRGYIPNSYPQLKKSPNFTSFSTTHLTHPLHPLPPWDRDSVRFVSWRWFPGHFPWISLDLLKTNSGSPKKKLPSGYD